MTDDLKVKVLPGPDHRNRMSRSGGGVRELGIRAVLERFVQQASPQVLQRRTDLTFSEHSFGFRPGRSAHGALRAAQRYVQGGRRIVVGADLERFFGRVNHDVLMGKLAVRIADQRVLRLIRHYLQSGLMVNGVCVARWEGTPQGGPLSPLLANVLLDEVDNGSAADYMRSNLSNGNGAELFSVNCASEEPRST